MLQPYFATSVIPYHSSFLEIFASFSGAIATFLSVLAVIGVYYWQLKKEKRDAARILLMEIRNAEKSITDIKNIKGVAETTFVMPVNSWFKFQHHFVADLDSDELVLVNDFYNLCALIQKEVDILKSLLPISNEAKIKLTQEKLLELAEKYSSDKKEYEKHKKAILTDCFFLEKEWYVPSLPEYRILQHIPNIRYITTSSCGEKMKRIAKISN